MRQINDDVVFSVCLIDVIPGIPDDIAETVIIIQIVIMYQLVKGPLQECRINSNYRVKTARSHTCGKGHCMFFGYAYIKETVRESL